MNRYIKVLMILISVLMLSGGCTGQKADDYSIDYLVLVNKLNPLPEDWESNLKLSHLTNSIGDDVEVEINAFNAYQDLKKELEKEGITVDLDSARRSVQQQQAIMDDFTKQYGADYAAKIVARPGYSEHHTGLALDLYLIIDGKDIIENEDLVQYPEIWAKIHEKLADHGFILRYLEDKEHITGYAYEPWHIRYIQDRDKGREIMASGVTLEEYLGAVEKTAVTVDLGSSALYSEDELKEMAVLIKCEFASWKDCQLKALRYTGDPESQDVLELINSIGKGQYVQAACFNMDFNSSDYPGDYYKENREYTGYPVLLGCDEDGSWEIVCFGQ